MSLVLASRNGTLQIEWRGNICILRLDTPGKSVNTLTRGLIEDLHAAFLELQAYPHLRGLVLASAKKSSFLAGADVSLFEQMSSRHEAHSGAEVLQSLFSRISQAGFPVVAAIQGSCLGGGLELALACRYRLCTPDKETKLGLPEVRLGLIPGAGGTQRLPKLVGLSTALDLILTGRQIDAKKALRMGLVHDVVPPNTLLAAALTLCQEGAAAKPFPRPRRPWLARILEATRLGRAIIRNRALATLRKTVRGDYPAPQAAVRAVLDGFPLPLSQGLALEADLFADCAMSRTSQALVHLFRASNAAKQLPSQLSAAGMPTPRFSAVKWVEPLRARTLPVGIVGAGLMGTGIATVLVENGMRAVLVDADAEGISRGMARIRGHFEEKKRRGRTTSREIEAALCRILPSLQRRSLRSSPIIIEAIFEDLAAKRELLRALESDIPGEFIFASNTSSIPITQIALGARNPERVVGTHFFSPVPRMPLLELVRTPQTAPDVVEAAFDLGRSMGKNVIVVNDGPGFYTTRVLGFMLAEALHALLEGSPIEAVDGALEAAGWPVGPLALIDEVGLDVGLHVVETLSLHFPQRIAVPQKVKALLQAGRLGRKSGCGFYRYTLGHKKQPDPEVYSILGLRPRAGSIPEPDIAERCLFAFVGEALRCLHDGILRTENDGDLGAIMGLGFPPFLGGPFHFVQTLGLEKFQARAHALAQRWGSLTLEADERLLEERSPGYSLTRS